MSAAGAQTRPVDLSHLARYTGGDAALNAEVLNLFTDQSAMLIAELRTALETSDQKRWREITHSLKGAARGIGAFALADAAAEAEAAVLDQAPAEALKALERLQARAHTVQLFIAAYLRR